MTAARRSTRAGARPKGRTTSARAAAKGAKTSVAKARGAKKVAGRVAKKAAKKAAKKRAVTPTRKTAVRKVAKKTAKKVAKKVAKRAAKKTGRRVAARPAQVLPFAPTAFAAQRAGAATRDLMLFELVRARAAVKAALQGLASGRASQPIAPGKWSLLEIVLHLSERDRVRLEEFERLHAGLAPSWRGMSADQIAAMNEAHLAPLRAHTWDEALRRMDSLRDELMERLARVPANEDVWRKGHAFADTMGHLAPHDRHHAQQIKLARIGG